MTEKHELSVNQEREKLRLRCIAGNTKLNEAWEKIKQMDHASSAWAEAMENWHQANERLSLFCTQLEALGYDICLYLEGGKKTKTCLEQGDDIGCRVCPSKIHYWENELMNLPSGGDPAKAREPKKVAEGERLL